MALDPTLVALIGTIMGGVGLKITEAWLSKGRVKVDEATGIRDELRQELISIRAENKLLEAEVDRWKKDYYDKLQENMLLKTHMITHGLDPPKE